MAQPMKKTEDTPTLEAICAEALELKDGDWKEAAEWARDALLKNRRLANAVLMKHLPKIVWAEIRKQAHATRNGFFQNGLQEAADSGAVSLRLSTERSVYEYMLSGGKKLGDATRMMLTEEALMHERNELGNRHRKVWFRGIAKLMPKADLGAIVRDHVSEDKITTLREKAEV